MKNFLQLGAGINTMPVLHALKVNDALWDQIPLRTKYPNTPHAQASDILVWFNAIPDDPSTVIDDIEVQPYPAWHLLPQLRPLIFDLMRAVEGVRLGRVVITKLRPGTCITPHCDGGAPATYFTRYQIALQALPGNVFHCGGETISMRTGDVWWFDNTQEHAVENGSSDDRIVVIVDIRQ